MRINNYQGTVADRPINTTVVESVPAERTHLPAHKPSFMDNILAHMNSQDNVVPAGKLPVYNKGL